MFNERKNKRKADSNFHGGCRKGTSLTTLFGPDRILKDVATGKPCIRLALILRLKPLSADVSREYIAESLGDWDSSIAFPSQSIGVRAVHGLRDRTLIISLFIREHRDDVVVA